jgi:virginiamycin B lyase
LLQVFARQHAACSAGGSTPIAPGGSQTGGSASKQGRVTFHITIPKKHHERLRVMRHHRPAYISVSTQAMTIAIAGPTNVDVTLGLTALSNDCTSNLAQISCNTTLGLQPCPTPANCYTANVSTYDAYDSSGNTIPAGAAVLSTAQAVAFSVAVGQQNNIGFVLSGVPARIAAVPVSSASLESDDAITLLGIGSHAFLAEAYDADGHIITGLGAPSFTVAVSGALAVTATQPPAGSPRFTIIAPTAFDLLDAATLTVSASYVTGLTDGCPQAGAVCEKQLLVNQRISIAEFPLAAGRGPHFIAPGPDGSLWFTECTAGRIGKIMTTGSVTEFTGLTTGSQPQGITTGADGNLWFVEQGLDQIGRITTAGAVTEFPITSSSAAVAIVAGPDGALWFTEASADRIGRMSTNGALTEFSTGITGSSPIGIAPGPDGALWFAEQIGNKIGRITTTGLVTEFSTGITGGSEPVGIAAGSDGALWFTECAGDRIGRITTTGLVSEYSGITSSSKPWLIAAGSDGNLWFTEQNGNRIGSVTTSGVITEFTGLTAGAAPFGIASGSDGNVWFAESSGSRIGRFRL